MTTFLSIIIAIMVLLTVRSLAKGIYLMGTGRDATGVKSNRMMVLRITFQALAVLGIVVLWLVKSS